MSFLTIGKLKLNNSIDRNFSLVEQSKEYSMIAGWLYKLGRDGILRLCVGDSRSMYVSRASTRSVGKHPHVPKTNHKKGRDNGGVLANHEEGHSLLCPKLFI